MAEYAGSATVVQWIWSGGTLNMSADTRSVSITPAMETIDATAGQDTSKQFLSSFTDWDVSWDGVAQNGTAGTVYSQALAPGVLGTLTIGPYGTAGSALKYSMPAFCQGAAISMPYSDVTTISSSWKTASGGTMVAGTF
jgi:hypothetical protein